MIDWQWLWQGFLYFLYALTLLLVISGLGALVKFVWEWIMDGGRHG